MTKIVNQGTALAIPGAGISEENELALTKRTAAVQFLTLMQGKSKPVESNEPQGIRAGDYLLGGRVRIPCGKEGNGFRAVVSVSRKSGVYFKNNEKEFDTHDDKSLEWARLLTAEAAGDKGAKIGLELLLWLPDYDSFAIMGFMNNARPEAAPAIAARKAKFLARISSKLVGKKNSFFVPKVEQENSSEPVKLPTPEQSAAALKIFEAYKDEKPAPPTKAGARPR